MKLNDIVINMTFNYLNISNPILKDVMTFKLPTKQSKDYNTLPHTLIDSVSLKSYDNSGTLLDVLSLMAYNLSTIAYRSIDITDDIIINNVPDDIINDVTANDRIDIKFKFINTLQHKLYKRLDQSNTHFFKLDDLLKDCIDSNINRIKFILLLMILDPSEGNISELSLIISQLKDKIILDSYNDSFISTSMLAANNHHLNTSCDLFYYNQMLNENESIFYRRADILVEKFFIDNLNKIKIINGYPGSGKTYTLINKILINLEPKNTLIITPTHKAKSVINIRLNDMLMTDWIERVRTSASLNIYNMKQYEDIKTIIIDESSMLSNDMLYNIIKIAKHTNCKIILIGDGEQCQPMGKGYTFNHLILLMSEYLNDKSDDFKTKHMETLTEIHRTHNNTIVDLIDKVRITGIGDIINIDNSLIYNNSQFYNELSNPNWGTLDRLFIPLKSQIIAYTNEEVNNINHKYSNKIINTIGSTYEPYNNNSKHYYGPKYNQLSEPMNLIIGGKYMITDKINPEKETTIILKGFDNKEYFSKHAFCKIESFNDKLVVLNAYKEKDEYKTIIVQRDWFENNSTYSWASTVHKCQGSGFETCAFVNNSFNVNKDLFYTAVSRSIDNLLIITDLQQVRLTNMKRRTFYYPS